MVDDALPLPILGRFVIIVAIFLLVPRLFERMRLPGLIGVLLAGVVVGPHGLHVMPAHPPVTEFFSEIGRLMLMFFAGLEIDLRQFSASRRRAIIFGGLTFALPMATGVALGRWLGYEWNSATLIGSLMASHTLLALPIVLSLGLIGRESVVVTVGATVLTDLGSLLVLAICLPIHTSGFSPLKLGVLLVELAVYVPVVLVGMRWLGRRFFDALGDNEELRLHFTFLVMAVAAIGATLIQLEGIIGAFLAGLAVNHAIGQQRIPRSFGVLGSALFIPAFFLTTGFLIDLNELGRTLRYEIAVVAGLVGGLIGSKFAAAAAAGFCFRYRRGDTLLMWSLTLPQVAATLATTLVAYDTVNAQGVRLIDARILNGVLVLLVVTSVLGPILTQRFGRPLTNEQPGPAGFAMHPPSAASPEAPPGARPVSPAGPLNPAGDAAPRDPHSGSRISK